MYAELHALSSFSFLRGASQPEELVAQAALLGYRALAITDECSLAGVVRAHVAAKEHGLALIIGSELRCADGLKLVALRCRGTRRRAAGCASVSPGASGSAWNCSPADSTCAVWKCSTRSAGGSTCRASRRAMCTCTGAAAAPSRTS